MSIYAPQVGLAVRRDFGSGAKDWEVQILPEEIDGKLVTLDYLDNHYRVVVPDRDCECFKYLPEGFWNETIECNQVEDV